MTDDPLKALGHLARASRPPEVDPRWDALAERTLPAADRTELLDGPEAALVGPAFEPLGPEFAESVSTRVLAGRRKGEVVPFPSRGVRRVLGALALAAALVLAVTLPSGAPELPTYRVEVAGGDRTERSDVPTTTPPRLSSGSRIELVARPEVNVDEPVTATARVIPTAGAPVAWNAAILVSGSGSVRLSATLGADLVLPAGDAMVEITITREDGVSTTLQVPVLVVE